VFYLCTVVIGFGAAALVGSDEIKAAPEYDPSRPFDREYESRLIEHHNRRKYWEWEGR